jgi:hypothetical protein
MINVFKRHQGAIVAVAAIWAWLASNILTGLEIANRIGRDPVIVSAVEMRYGERRIGPDGDPYFEGSSVKVTTRNLSDFPVVLIPPIRVIVYNKDSRENERDVAIETTITWGGQGEQPGPAFIDRNKSFYVTGKFGVPEDMAIKSGNVIVETRILDKGIYSAFLEVYDRSESGAFAKGFAKKGEAPQFGR